MADLLHELIYETANACPQGEALRYRGQSVDYGSLAAAVRRSATALLS
ncbi:MAG: hypothetical protein HKL98_01660, partial [Burkholderiales bacterium]|nr:hypothetical protein [Burkholderiales bacterium]